MFVIDNAVIAQTLGVVAMYFGVAGFLSTDDRKMKILLVFQPFILAVHFTLLGAHMGATMASITVLRNGCSISPKLQKLGLVFMLFYAGFGLWRYSQPIDLLPTLGALIGSYSLFYQKGLWMRITLLGATLSWLVYNLLVGSWGPLLMEALVLSASLRTIYRMNRAKVYPV